MQWSSKVVYKYSHSVLLRIFTSYYCKTRLVVNIKSRTDFDLCLQAGVSKLNEAKALVDELKRRAAEQSVLLRTKQQEADSALQEITTSMQVQCIIWLDLCCRFQIVHWLSGRQDGCLGETPFSVLDDSLHLSFSASQVPAVLPIPSCEDHIPWAKMHFCLFHSICCILSVDIHNSERSNPSTLHALRLKCFAFLSQNMMW